MVTAEEKRGELLQKETWEPLAMTEDMKTRYRRRTVNLGRMQTCGGSEKVSRGDR